MPSHQEKEGNRYSWDAPPADTGHPGQDYNCRCSAQPDLSGLLDATGPQKPVEAATPRRLTAVNVGKLVAIGEVARRLLRTEERVVEE